MRNSGNTSPSRGRFVELTGDPAYTAIMNPDAERWRELAAYDFGTAEAMLSAGRYLYVLFCCNKQSKNI